MTILHVGKLGPGTKAFLLKNYEETDEAFAVSYIVLDKIKPFHSFMQ